MSKHKNVHPDHYKTGGSVHQGEEVVQEEHRKKLAREQAELERWQNPDTAPEEEGTRKSQGEDDES